MADSPTTCPFCNDSILIPEEFFGSEVECPNCHKQFMIPKITEEEDLSGSAGMVEIDCPLCGTQNFIDENFVGSIKCKNCSCMLEIAFDDMVPCPFCGKDISKNDTTCMHCQREILSGAAPKNVVIPQSKPIPAAVKNVNAVPVKNVAPMYMQGQKIEKEDKEDGFVLILLQVLKIITIALFFLIFATGTAVAIYDWDKMGITCISAIVAAFYVALVNYLILCWFRGIYKNVMRIRIAAEKKSGS